MADNTAHNLFRFSTMNTIDTLEKDNQYNFRRLITAVKSSFNTLNLLICISNTPNYRNKVIERYESELSEKGVQCSRVRLARPSLSLKQSLQGLVKQQPDILYIKSVATILGADELLGIELDNLEADTDRFFFSLQWTREALRQFKIPIIVWMDPQTAKATGNSAPDFWSWRGGVFEFQDPIDSVNPRQQHLETILSRLYEQLSGLEKALILSPLEEKVRIRQRYEDLKQEIVGYEQELIHLNLEVKHQKSFLPTFDKIDRITSDRVQNLRHDRFRREFEQLAEEYKALSYQLSVTLNAGDQVRLRMQLEHLETRMEAIDSQLIVQDF